MGRKSKRKAPRERNPGVSISRKHSDPEAERVNREKLLGAGAYNRGLFAMGESFFFAARARRANADFAHF
jgi:hypothetical protein